MQAVRLPERSWLAQALHGRQTQALRTLPSVLCHFTNSAVWLHSGQTEICLGCGARSGGLGRKRREVRRERLLVGW